ncbi:MAG: DnaB-like helicase C-terminal domain-containing protein [Bacillales bacterium]|nr:DnaB-like helicase C-terminal domain-containing protein [Bacillales bacterium]
MEIIKSKPGFLTILAGKTDMGKSTITIFDCSEKLKEGKKVLFFSYEYFQSIIFNKMISHFNMSWSDLFNLNIIDSMALNLDVVKKTIELKRENIDIVYIDYLDLLKKATYVNDEGKIILDDTDHIQEICRELASIAKEYNIAIVLLSQVGASTEFEKTIEQLNAFTYGLDNSYKMFIGKGNVIDSRINTDDMSHLILVNGNNLKHFSTINITEVYHNR